jgi:phosphotransferase family enzyme
MRDQLAEIPLAGGTNNRGLVVRRGDTVRRPLRPTSTAVHALLTHLEEVGFDGAPRLLGIDDQGREVLTFVPGEAVTPPYPDWALTDDALRSVAVLLRRYHEAVADFRPSGYDWSAVAPPEYDEGLACHNDVNLDNVIFRDGRAAALIDFDWANPGSAVWDVAGAIRLWAPLRPDRYIDDSRRGASLDRLRTFVTAYGVELAPERLVEAVRLHHDRMYQLIADGAGAGNQGFAAYWEQSEQRALATAAWYVEEHDTLVRALS